MIENLTIKEHNLKYPATGTRSKYYNIRVNARKVLKNTNLVKECYICKYNHYVEAAHLKGIAKFDDTAKISEVNDLKNLIYLCPNHHWELDNGIINIIIK